MLPRASLRTLAATACVLLTAAAGFAADAVTLFDGKSLAGWKPSKNSPEGTYKVADGVLQLRGGQGHLYYVGPDGKASFKNFEFTAKVRPTRPPTRASISTPPTKTLAGRPRATSAK